MANRHMVICDRCGKRFDANRGCDYEPNTRRYTCKTCSRTQQAASREEKTGMRQSMGAMIAKIAFGTIFILAGFLPPEEGWSVAYFLTALILGAALIAWGIVPYRKAQERARKEAAEPMEFGDSPVRIPQTCPFCGGTGTGDICEYCGKPFGE